MARSSGWRSSTTRHDSGAAVAISARRRSGSDRPIPLTCTRPISTFVPLQLVLDDGTARGRTADHGRQPLPAVDQRPPCCPRAGPLLSLAAKCRPAGRYALPSGRRQRAGRAGLPARLLALRLHPPRRGWSARLTCACDGRTLLVTDLTWRVRRNPSFSPLVPRVSIYGSGVEDRDLRSRRRLVGARLRRRPAGLPRASSRQSAAIRGSNCMNASRRSSSSASCRWNWSRCGQGRWTPASSRISPCARPGRRARRPVRRRGGAASDGSSWRQRWDCGDRLAV